MEKIENERWSDIPGFPGKSVSNMGRVRSREALDRYVLRGHKGSVNAAAQVQFSKKGIPHGFRIARLVGAAFCKGYSEDKVVQFKDGDQSNCKASNLKWVGRSEVAKKALNKPKP